MKHQIESFFLPFLLALLFITANADADTIKVNPKNIISVVTADWNSDGQDDMAVLAFGEGDENETELFLYLSGPDVNQLSLAVHRVNPAWSGEAAGTKPRLEVTDRGSLIIHSQNEAIGRNRWHKAVTIAFRNSRFIVAGFTYSEYDTLDTKYSKECDINLLTGKGVKDGKAIRTKKKLLHAEHWSDEFLPKACE